MEPRTTDVASTRTRLAATGLSAVLVAAGLLVGGCATGGDPDGAVEQGPDSPGPVGAEASPGSRPTRIPDDFPLTVGMSPDPADVPVNRDGSTMPEVDLCGTRPMADTDPLDRMGADNSGGEASDTRELLLLASAREARAVAASLGQAATECAGSEVDGIEYAESVVWQTPVAAEGAVAVVHHYGLDRQERPGALVQHAVPVGAAVLFTSTYGEWPDATVHQGVVGSAEAIAETVAAMEVFAGLDRAATTSSPGPGDGEDGTASPATVTDRGPIPDGLDLTLGLPQDGGDFQVGPATPQGDGVGEVEVCRQTVWPDAPDAQGRLVVNASGPEYADAREVWVLPDTESALGVMDRVSSVVQGCEGTGNRVWRTHGARTQQDTLTFSLTWTDGLGASVFQLTRVGRTLLMTHHYGEGTLDGVPDTVRDRSAVTRRLVTDLCSAAAELC